MLNKIEEINDDNDSVEYNSVKISLMLDRIKKINEKIVIMEKGKKEMAESVTYDWNGFGWADLLREFVKHQDLTKEESEFYDKVKLRVKEYIQKYEFDNPYVLGKIIDTEGEIFEGKNYGWFGVSDNIIDPMQWTKEYIEILEKHKEDYMVSLDCHV